MILDTDFILPACFRLEWCYIGAGSGHGREGFCVAEIRRQPDIRLVHYARAAGEFSDILGGARACLEIDYGFDVDPVEASAKLKDPVVRTA